MFRLSNHTIPLNNILSGFKEKGKDKNSTTTMIKKGNQHVLSSNKKYHVHQYSSHNTTLSSSKIDVSNLLNSNKNHKIKKGAKIIDSLPGIKGKLG